MWTPKRILILIAGTFLFLGGFAVYDFFLGGYDGLPPLPDDWLQHARVEPFIPQINDPEPDKKMRMAFGVESKEARRKFILDSTSKNMLLAVDNFDLEQDGRVKLSPFSVALFPKKKGDGGFPEINTIQCEEAYLTLDKAVSNFTELTSRRIIGVELRGAEGVNIGNNRRTPEKNDDVEISIKLAPVKYEERSNKIWTEGFVELLDLSSRPDPTKIRAKGMEVFLAKEAQPLRGKAGPPVKKDDTVNGVELLILKSHVDMHLYVDAKSGFLAAQEGPAKPPAVKPPAAPDDSPAEKAHVLIQTAGSMRYDLPKEQAQFDSPAPPPGAAPTEQVQLTREHKLGPDNIKYDTLVCDTLKLAFRRKAENPGAAAKDPLSGNKEIEEAHATARPDHEVTLTMDSEKLAAWGNDFRYRSPTRTSGPQTILQGQPMHAIRDGNMIQAQELHLIGADKTGSGQQAFAKGPGRIDLLDKGLGMIHGNADANPKDDKQQPVALRDDKQQEADAAERKKPRFPVHVLWKDSLISTKDKDGNHEYDLLTFTGDAAFIDEDHKQTLKGQRIQVWLEATTGPDGNKQQAGGGPRQEPRRVEAYERVSVDSPEMIVESCKKLVVIFKKVTATDDMLPAPAGAANAALGGIGDKPAPVVLQPPLADPRPAVAPGAGAGAGADKDKARKPFRITADEVVAFVSTIGTKKQLQELVTEGNVHVHQEGATSKDKGIDITGVMLNLIYHPLGNRLLVNGDTRSPAKLQLGELTLIGPKVDIDQKENTATVDGIGAMRMPSDKTFDGGKAAKEGSYVTIHWTKDMIFDGKFAKFEGGVQAFQDNASLKCQSMQATLDRFVNLKEGQKEKENAKLDKVVCDLKVWCEEKVLSPDGKLASYRRLVGVGLDMDNPEGIVRLAGPGKVYSIAAGSSDVVPPQPGQPLPPNAKQDQTLKLTRVDFNGRMHGHNKPGGPRRAIFYDNVEVYHQPGEDPDAPLMPNQPPKDGFYMRCKTLDVSTQERDGKTSQFMVAKDDCDFRTPEFFGNAATIKYDQSQEIIIFEGNPTTLYKLRRPGERASSIQGQKILYNRKNGTFFVDGGTQISAW